MGTSDIEARAFLRDFEDYPKETRGLFLYVICQTMLRQGLLELLGAFQNPGRPVELLFRNPCTGNVFEIGKPDINADEEQAIGGQIDKLLLESA